MRTIEEFREYYQSNIIPILEPLEQTRKLIKKKITRMNIIAGIIVFLTLLIIAGINYLLVISNHNDAKTLLTVSGVLLTTLPLLFFTNPLVFIFGIIYIAILTTLNFKYRGEFKNLVVEPVIRFVTDNFEYNPQYASSDKIYQILVSKNLNLKTVFWLMTQDHISIKDKARNISFDFCEAKIRFNYFILCGGLLFVAGIHYSVGIVLLLAVLVFNYLKGFRGLFFSIDFNKAFDGETIIVPNAKKIIEPHLQKVELEDITFEKHFDIYSSNQIAARYILTPSFMERLNEFIKTIKLNGQFKIIFKENMMYMQIPYSRPLFEPKIFKSLYNIDAAEEYYNDLVFGLGIQEELKLNTYIWSKQ